MEAKMCDKQTLYKEIETLPDDVLDTALSFVLFLKLEHKEDALREFARASQSSMDFWDSDIDNEVWNNA
jgi:hypothetical protein